MATDQDQPQIQTTVRVFTILDALKELEGAGITEIGAHTGLANSTIHRHLSTLCEMGYVVKEGDTYHVGLRFLDIGEFARTRKQVYQLAEPKVEELAAQTEERCQIVGEEHGRGIYVHLASGPNAVHTDSRVGKTLALHATSVGKSIMAELPAERVDDIIDRHGLEPVTEHTITDVDEFKAELDRIRERGYAFNDEGNIAGLRSVGAPVFDADGSVVGALSISGPSHRLKGDWYRHDIPDMLLGAANEIELNLKYDTSR
jgi:DNA-binding IclR family transcriptional regulator